MNEINMFRYEVVYIDEANLNLKRIYVTNFYEQAFDVYSRWVMKINKNTDTHIECYIFDYDKNIKIEEYNSDDDRS